MPDSDVQSLETSAVAREEKGNKMNVMREEIEVQKRKVEEQKLCAQRDALLAEAEGGGVGGRGKEKQLWEDQHRRSCRHLGRELNKARHTCLCHGLDWVNRGRDRGRDTCDMPDWALCPGVGTVDGAGPLTAASALLPPPVPLSASASSACLWTLNFRPSTYLFRRSNKEQRSTSDIDRLAHCPDMPMPH